MKKPSILLVASTIMFTGCGKKDQTLVSAPKSPEQIILGAWKMDKGATEKTNPNAAGLGDSWYEFKDDGTQKQGFGATRQTVQGSWKVVKSDGNKLILHLNDDLGARDQEVVVLDEQRISLLNPSGEIHFRRGKAEFEPLERLTPSGRVISPRATIDTGLPDGLSYRCVAVRADAKVAAVGGSDKIQVWDLGKKEKVAEFKGRGGPIALSPDGKTLASADDGLNLYEVPSGEPKSGIGATGATEYWFSPDLDLLVVTMYGKIRGIDLKSGKDAFEWLADKGEKNLGSCAVAWQAKVIATGHQDGTIRLWEFPSGKLLKTWDSKGREMKRMATSSDGKWLAAIGGYGSAAQIWDVAQEKVISTTQVDYFPTMLFLADNRTFVYTLEDKVDKKCRIILEDLQSGKRRLLEGHPSEGIGALGGIAVTPDGKTLVSIGGKASKTDATLKIWDIGSP